MTGDMPEAGDAPTIGDNPEPERTSHRGGFGDYGGDAGGQFIERTFRERIVLVGVALAPRTLDEADAGLDELALLVDTAGADEAGRLVQRRDRIDPSTYVGRGKLEEILSVCEAVDADTVVFDNDLSPAQQGTLEKVLGRSALDRTAVILDIFAQNASSTEGKAQVELAQLRYRLPRLRGKGGGLSQQGGGIGTRGPGETQLEVDRRRLVRRVHTLETRLEQISRHRATQRKGRGRSRVTKLSLVGYTNAGKSTLLNRLSDAGVVAEDRLFATLDATTRRVELPGGEAVLMTDTVGFIRRLPHQLVEAFKGTLEVVVESDLLVHVVDASASDPGGQVVAVREVLAEIDAADVPEMMVLNKTDAVDADTLAELTRRYPDAIHASAGTGWNVEEVLAGIAERLRAETQLVELAMPFARGDVLASIHREGEVVSESTDDEGYVVWARLDPPGLALLDRWIRTDEEAPVPEVPSS